MLSGTIWEATVMTIWRLTTMNLHELLRRLRAGESRNAIVRTMHVSPHTVAKYHRWAEAQGLLGGPCRLDDAGRAAGADSGAIGRSGTERIQPGTLSHGNQPLLERGRETMTIWRFSRQHPQFTASPRRSIAWCKAFAQAARPVTLRIETAPGEVAQVDFGFIGYLRRPDRRVAQARLFTVGLESASIRRDRV
jgi:hypothetical protein